MKPRTPSKKKNVFESFDEKIQSSTTRDPRVTIYGPPVKNPCITASLSYCWIVYFFFYYIYIYIIRNLPGLRNR